MKSRFALGLVAALLSCGSEALYIAERREGSPRVVSLSTERKRVPNLLERDRLRRRSGTLTATLTNEETLYYVNATLGTPAQSMRLHLDTGSSDLWVNTPSSPLCEEAADPCTFGGTYVANHSSTYEYVGSYFNISYVDGSGANGDYATDTLNVAGTSVPKMQFGIGYQSTLAEGILGLGYPAIEVQATRAGKQPYKNFPAQLVADGTIASNVYSLWLNDLDASTGSILFGGVDTAQYHGDLTTLPVQKEGGEFAEFLITLTSLTMGSASVASEQALAVLLDCGSSLTYLPDTWVQDIFKAVDAEYEASAGAAFVPCSLAQQDTSVVFNFSGPTISVPMSELVLDLSGAAAAQNGSQSCLFGLAPAGNGSNVLGDTFLRSAYVVFDITKNEISIAQTSFNTTGTASNVVEVPSDGVVPGATAVASAAAAASGIGRSGGSVAGVNAASPSIPSVAVGLTVAAAFAAGLVLVVA